MRVIPNKLQHEWNVAVSYTHLDVYKRQSVTLKENSSRAASGFRQNKARSILVVTEMALALILLVGAALLIRTFETMRSEEPGFDAHNVLTMELSLIHI